VNFGYGMSCGQKCSLEKFYGALLTVKTGCRCLRLMSDKQLGGFTSLPLLSAPTA